MNPLVSLIILNYNGERFLPEVLNHLQNITYQPVEIIVVDNASTDNSLRFLSDQKNITLIVNQKNLGFPEGNNVGIRKAKGKYIALVNNDLKVTPGWLEPIVEFLEKNPEYAAVQPKILSWDKPNEFEYAGGAGGYIDQYGYPFSRGRILRNCEKDQGQYDTSADVFWTSGACMVFRADIIKEVGEMDADFFLHQEEIDWCWRMLLAGYKLRAIPQSVVFHYGGGSLNYDSPQKLYYNYRNNLTMLIKNMELKNLISMLPIRLLLDFAAFFHNIVLGKFGNAFSIMRGYGYVLRNIVNIYRKRKHVQQRIRKIQDHQLKHLVYSRPVILSYYLGKKHFVELNMKT